MSTAGPTLRSRERQLSGVHTIQKLIEQYPEEWLAIDVKVESEGQPQKGVLVCHAKDQEEVWQTTKHRRRLYIVYAGPPLKEGYAAAFRL